METYKEAIDLYVQALRKTPEGITPLGLLGAALLEEGKTGEAIDILSLAVQDKESAFAYRTLGRAQETAGSNDAALASYKKAREFDRKDFDTHVAMGKLYQKMNRTSEAVQAFNAALNTKPDAGDVLFLKARCFIALSDVENARKVYGTLQNLGNTELARRLADELPLITDAAAESSEGTQVITGVAVQSEPAVAPPRSAPAEGPKSAEPSKADIMAQLKEYKEKLKSSPYDPEMYFEMGLLLNKIERPKDAVQAFSLALKFDSSHAAAKYEKALALHTLGRTDEAKTLSFQLRKDGQEKLSDMLNNALGVTAEQTVPQDVAPAPDAQPKPEAKPQPAAAPPVAEPVAVEKPAVVAASTDDIIAKAKNALKANPFDSTTYLQMGKAYHEIGKHRDAMTAYNLAIRFTPTLIEAKYHKALLLLDQDKTDDARALYEAMKASATDAMKAELTKRLGIGGTNGTPPKDKAPALPAENASPAPAPQANVQPAPAPLDEPPAIQAEEPPPPPHAEPALAPMDMEAELDESKEEIKKNPYDPKAYLRLGLAYEKLERYADALKGFNLALQFNPDLSVATYHKGLCYLKMGDEEQALQEYTTLREEGHAELAQKLNDAFKSNGETSQEAESAGSAKEEPPPKYGIEGDPENILEACKKVIKQDPYDPEAYLRMGKAYKDLEKYQEAINTFGLAVKANGEFHEADYERGLCYLKLGEEEKALQIYTNLLKEGQKDLAKKLFDLFLKRLK